MRIRIYKQPEFQKDIAEREAYEERNLRKTTRAIQERTLTRYQYYKLMHNIRYVMWRIRQLKDGTHPIFQKGVI